MKLSIRLQNHGCRNHPLWWIVVAPNRKNIKGRFNQHLGYWHLIMRHNVKRGVILNLNRIKHWISCGAVPTNRVQRLLHEFGMMPKPWFYVKSEEELEKLKPNEEELDDKKKRKIQAKEKKKLREEEGYLSVFAQYKLGHRPLPHKRDWKRLYVAVQDTVIEQERENDMLRSIMMQVEYTKYQQMRKLSNTLPEEESLVNLQKKLKVLQEDLANLQKNSINLHPVKRGMIMEKINQLVPKIYELQQKQDREIESKDDQETVEQSLLRRKALHEVMVKRITVILKEIETYYKMLEPLTRESYLEYLVTKVGMNYNEAVKETDEDFAEYENEGIAPTKGILYRNYNLDAYEEEADDQELNPDIINGMFGTHAQGEEVQNQEVAEEGEQQDGEVQQGQQHPVEQQVVDGVIEQQGLGKQPTDELSEQQIARLMQQQSRAETEEQNPRFGHVEDFDPHQYNLLDRRSVAKMILDKKILVPTTNHVNPFPDLKSYIPEQFYEIPDRWNNFLKSVPSYYPEDELLRYREKMRSKQQNIRDQLREKRNASSV